MRRSPASVGLGQRSSDHVAGHHATRVPPRELHYVHGTDTALLALRETAESAQIAASRSGGEPPEHAVMLRIEFRW